MASTTSVYFVDPWPNRYQTPVRRAISWLEESQLQYEAAKTASSPPSLKRPLWVVSHYAVNGLELFVAQRAGNAVALTARSVDELCHNIRQLWLRRPRSGALFQLMYKSTATRPMTAEDLTQLLQQARARNSRLGVTGVLLYKEGQFLQVLEGLERPVRQVFADIAQDDRHEDIQTIFTSPIERRTFPTWQMAFVACDAVEDATSAPADAPLPLGDDICVQAPLVGNVADALGAFRVQPKPRV